MAFNHVFRAACKAAHRVRAPPSAAWPTISEGLPLLAALCQLRGHHRPAARLPEPAAHSAQPHLWADAWALWQLWATCGYTSRLHARPCPRRHAGTGAACALLSFPPCMLSNQDLVHLRTGQISQKCSQFYLMSFCCSCKLCLFHHCVLLLGA